MIVVHPGVDTKVFLPAPRDKAARAALGWHRHRTILIVGRLQRRKGHDMMIEALPHVRQVVPDVRLAIVGQGPERGRLAELARQHDVEDLVIFHGKLADSELLRAYQQCDLFALPNREINGDIEGFGMVLLEAQACGQAVIAGDSGGTREAMIPGKTGDLVDCTRAKPLANAVVRLLSDEDRRHAYGKNGREWVCRNFDWEALARQSAELFGVALRPSCSQPSLASAGLGNV